MKKMYSLYFMVFAGVIFTGCAQSFDINPKYDDKSKIVNIDSYVMSDISYFNKRNSNIDTETMGSTGYIIKEARSNSGVCNYIYTSNHEAKGHWYYTSSALDSLRMQYKNNCEIEKVGSNIDFVECNSNYYLVSSRMKDGGYGSLIQIKMNYNCFKDMKTHFKNVVNKNSKMLIKKQEVKVKKEIQETTLKNRYFTGEFSSFSDSKDCQLKGDIDVYVKGNEIGLTFYNDIDGYISVDLVKGNVIGKKFNAKSNSYNIKYKGDIYKWTVTGTYEIQNCKGSFEANLDED